MIEIKFFYTSEIIHNVLFGITYDVNSRVSKIDSGLKFNNNSIIFSAKTFKNEELLSNSREKAIHRPNNR